MDLTWLGIQMCISWSQIQYLKRKVGMLIRTSLFLVWPPFASCGAANLLLHGVDQAVDCGLWNLVPLLFNDCVKLLDIGGNWNTLSYTSIQSIPNMFNGWHGWWVQLPGIVYRSLRHELRMNGTTMALRISSHYLCAFKLPLIKCNCVHCP